MTPTSAILGLADKRLTATDTAGRKIVARRLNALDKLRLLKSAGPVLSENQAWLGVAMLAVSAVELDGVPIPMPVNELQIEALVGKLGDPGLDAIAVALAATEPDTLASAGNSPGTPS